MIPQFVFWVALAGVIVPVLYLLCMHLLWPGRHANTYKSANPQAGAHLPWNGPLDQAWQQWPRVSVLLAARNEEQTLERCLDALLACHYAKDQLEILVGNDGSTDQTGAIVQAYASKHPNIKIVPIEPLKNGLLGKANVLAQLARQASGTYFLITDADVAVNPYWAQHMVANAMRFSTPAKPVGMLNGFTGVGAHHRQNLKLWGLQQQDWALAQAILFIGASHNMPITGMGNNMLVSRQAYEAAGGYEKIPFHVTEDYALYQAIKQQNYAIKTLIRPGTAVTTLPEKGASTLLKQRKRWMHGAVKVPWPFQAFLISMAAYHVFWWVLLASNVIFALVLAALKYALQVGLQVRALRQAGHTVSQKGVWLFSIYSPLLTVATVISYLRPGPVQWKGRSYERQGSSYVQKH